MKTKIKNNKGITLIALIITIIVMLILVVATINVVINSGLIASAKNAVEKTRTAYEEEAQVESKIKVGEENLIDYLNNLNQEDEEPEEDPGDTPTTPTIPQVSTLTTIQTSTKEAKDAKGNKVMIPKGFKFSSQSGTTVQQGIVAEDSEGNQYVWVPVSNIDASGNNKIILDNNSEVEITLGRYTFNTSTGAETMVQKGSEYAKQDSSIVIDGYFKELTASRVSSDETENSTAKNLQGFIESVRDNGGYYIARYEASYGGGNKALSKPSTSTTLPISSPTGTLWNFMTQPYASAVCRSMYTENTEIECDLVNSYAWDTAIVYIQKCADSAYSKAVDGNGILKNTGSTGDEKCKINDMAKNCYEWTTEYSLDSSSGDYYPCVSRGGSYNSGYDSTSNRTNGFMDRSDSYVSFRSLLYIL